MVLLINGAPANPVADARPDTHAFSLADEVAGLMKTENFSEKDALKRVAKARGIGKSEAYREFQRSQSRKR